MQEIYLKRNWWIAFLFGTVLAGMAGFCLYVITWPALKAARLGQPLPPTWSWPAIVIVDVGIILLHGSLFFHLLFQLQMVFTKEGVRMPGIFKSKFMRWADVAYVDGVSIRSSLLKLTDSKQSIIINKLYYQEPEKLMALVTERLPESCYWRD